ncbi:MAG: hypothetical protein JW995_14395 [Melioribacteraceae bacterium]|nr:hypothetical protein [Melioribacteraceae bacterium]
MAGSYVYKKEYYDLSRNIGEDLVKQVMNSGLYDDNTIIMNNDVSCREQISLKIKNRVMQPVDFLQTDKCVIKIIYNFTYLIFNWSML